MNRRRGWAIEEETDDHQASGPSSRIASLASNRFIGPVTTPPETAGGTCPIAHPFVIQEMKLHRGELTVEDLERLKDSQLIRRINHLEWPKYGWEVKP